MHIENIRSEHLLQSVSHSFAMVIFDLTGNILWANPLFSKIMGYSLEELRHMHHKQFCLSDFVNSTQYISFWRNLNQGKPFHKKVMRVNREKKRIWLDAFYVPIIDENRLPYAVLKIATDVTKQQHILQESVNEFMGLVEEMTASTEHLHSFAKKIVTDMQQLCQEAEKAIKTLEQIQAITAFVKEIALKSNLLGLNASIEAARAGDHGRGFAIVANEIREMAEKSKDAAEHIKIKLDIFSKLTVAIDYISQNMKDDINNTYESLNELKKSYEYIIYLTEKLAKII